MSAIQLLIIDPQNDFCDIPSAALPVAGASRDLERLAALLDRRGQHLAGVTVTLDSHHAYDIAHPSYWRDPSGLPPAPFTRIDLTAFESGSWVPVDARRHVHARLYLRETALTIWPEHCLVGSWGQGIYMPLHTALAAWERREHRVPVLLHKGLNPDTEHFSAFEAEVPDLHDAHTQFDARQVAHLVAAERVIVGGEALSHCVAASVRTLIRHLGPDFAAKLVLLSDASSPVPGFEAEAADFLAEMAALGVRLAVTETVLD
ncbi:isochorismatase family protein [Paludibacterium yongneupense]|uniref:isochorismatase family protein n=1 Tax=Paludibacterium yongneupense TaxID=400061 RepID=UPI00040C956A|nr:isochorismatase family protein [Paludibacterium yongneupense]